MVCVMFCLLNKAFFVFHFTLVVDCVLVLLFFGIILFIFYLTVAIVKASVVGEYLHCLCS